MIEPQGNYYRIWRVLWLAVRIAVLLRPGELGLEMPRKSKHRAAFGGLRAHRVWWRDHYIWPAMRRIIASGGVLTTLFGVFTVMATIGLWLFQYDNNPYLGVWIPGVIAGFYSLGAITVYSAYLALRAQTPEQYAATAVSGKSASEVFKTLAHEMAGACEQFLLAAVPLEDTLSACEDDCDEVWREKLRNRRKEIKKKIDEVKNIVVRQREDIRKLMELKVIAADRLNIPKHRLCDYLLQYNPSIHGDLVSEYLRAIRAVSRNLDNLSELSVSRARALLERNSEIVERFKRRISVLGDLFSADSLHGSLHRIASRHSTSGALSEYADAIAIVSEHARDLLLKRKKDEARILKKHGDSLALLHTKQRAYPGYDLHEALTKLCIQASTVCDELNPAVIKTQTETLERVSGREREKKYTEGGPYELAHGEDELSHLISLSETISQYTEKSRKEIACTFNRLAAEYLYGGDKFIITHGYSKTVRDVLENCVADLLMDEGHRLSILIMGGDADIGVQSVDDARRMQFEVRACTRRSLGLKKAEEQCVVTMGDELLLTNLQSPSARRLVVLGAEAFDQTRRIIHPRGARQRLEQLRPDAVFFLAEEYKYQQKPFLENDEFCRYHLDRLEIYKWREGFYIITEAGTRPKTEFGTS